MKIRSDLPIKYYLNLHQEEDLQDEFAVLFDVINYLIKVIQVKSKKLELDSFKFSSKSLKYVFGERLKDETFKQNLVKRLKKLISTEYITVDGETMCITKKGLQHFYTTE